MDKLKIIVFIFTICLIFCCNNKNTNEPEIKNPAEVVIESKKGIDVISTNANGAFLEYVICETVFKNIGDETADEVKIKVKYEFIKEGEIYDTRLNEYSLNSLLIPEHGAQIDYDNLEIYGRKFIMPGEKTPILWMVEKPLLKIYWEPNVYYGIHIGKTEIMEITWIN